MADVEGTAPVGDLRMEQHLQQDVRKLLAQLLLVDLLLSLRRGDDLGEFLGLLPQIGQQTGVGLRLLPGPLTQCAGHQRHSVLHLVGHRGGNLGPGGAPHPRHSGGVLVGADDLPVDDSPTGVVHSSGVSVVTVVAVRTAGTVSTAGTTVAGRGLQLPVGVQVHQQARGLDQLLPLVQAFDNGLVVEVGGHHYLGIVEGVSPEVGDDPSDADRHLFGVADIITEQRHRLHRQHSGKPGIQ